MSLRVNVEEGAIQRLANGIVLFTMLAAVCLIPTALAQETPAGNIISDENCGDLHAGIRAELVRRDPAYTQPPFVMLNFILLNDGEAPINSTAGAWKISIDGKELNNSGWILGNGPRPTNGYGILSPGESYSFGVGLEISKYFPEEREYKVSWGGEGFQSSTITVTITPKP
jgi:hypothetical protein